MAKVLIVEDEAVVAVDLAALVQAAGHQVSDVVADGPAAVLAAVRDEPDLVLMDMTIRGGLDGVQTARLIRERAPEVKLVFVTAHSDAVTRARVEAVKPSGFLLKPFNEEDIATVLTAALRSELQGLSGG